MAMKLKHSFLYTDEKGMPMKGMPMYAKGVSTPEEAREQFESWKKYLKKVAIFQEEEASEATVWIS